MSKYIGIMGLFILMLSLGISSVWAGQTPLNSSASPAQDGACPIDLVLVLDSSGSISPQDFTTMKTWATDLVGRFTLGPADANVGVVQFSDNARREIALSADANAINNAIAHMRKLDSGTYISDGLAEAHSLLQNGRADAPKVIIVLTDGVSDGDPIGYANLIRGEGANNRITILGVAVGQIDLGEIIGIAGGEFNVIPVPDFDGLRLTLSVLRDYSCAIAVEGTTSINLSDLPTLTPAPEVAVAGTNPTPTVSIFNSQTPNPATNDFDLDGIVDPNDNCPAVSNPDQADSNANGVGDACDAAVVATVAPLPPAPTATPIPTEVAIVVDPLPDDVIADTQLVFSSNRDGDTEIFRVDADGSNETQLTSNAYTDDKPSFSTDGTQIAWESNAGGTFSIWTMNIDGSNKIQLTDNAGQDWGPSWSPDDSQISFHSTRGGWTGIWVMNADGSNLRQITRSPNAIDRSAEWSSDGKQLVFYSDRTEGREIYIVNLETGEEKQLTSNEVYDGLPDWSPTGDLIVFGSTRTGAGNLSDICVMDTNGDNVTCLTNTIGTDDDPIWSPDGNYVAFESGRSGNFDIWVMDADGTNLRQLTSDPARDWSVDWGVKP